MTVHVEPAHAALQQALHALGNGDTANAQAALDQCDRCLTQHSGQDEDIEWQSQFVPSSFPTQSLDELSNEDAQLIERTRFLSAILGLFTEVADGTSVEYGDALARVALHAATYFRFMTGEVEPADAFDVAAFALNENHPARQRMICVQAAIMSAALGDAGKARQWLNRAPRTESGDGLSAQVTSMIEQLIAQPEP